MAAEARGLFRMPRPGPLVTTRELFRHSLSHYAVAVMLRVRGMVGSQLWHTAMPSFIHAYFRSFNSLSCTGQREARPVCPRRPS